jgi:hypothetical protein
MKSIIKVANKLSSVLTDSFIVNRTTTKSTNVKSNITDNSISSKSLIRKDEIVSFSILTEADLIRKDFIGRTLIDEQVINDLLALLNEKILSDEFSFQDTIDFLNEIGVEDTYDLTDVLINIDVLKELFEEINIFDEPSIALDKDIEDRYDLDSFGFLISQDYTEDNSYFLEDYVGQSRIFN